MRLCGCQWATPLAIRSQGDTTGYLRSAMRHRDWNDAVRNGLVPDREAGAAAAIAVQDLFRECADRTGEGLPRKNYYHKPPPGPVLIASPCPVQRLDYVDPVSDADAYDKPKKEWVPPCSYEGDHGQGNHQNGAIVNASDDLSWYFGSSALELGLSSSFDAMVTQLLIGGVNGNRSDPAGPSPRMLAAASRQIRVRRILKKLSPRTVAVLEAAYSDRRYTLEDLEGAGPGAGALIWSAKQQQRDLQESPTGTALAAMQRLLMALSGTGKRRAPEWSPLESELHAVTGSFRDRVIQSAETLLKRAQEAYAKAADDDHNTRGPDPGGRRRRRSAPGLVAAGSVGTDKRKLIEAPRKRAKAE